MTNSTDTAEITGDAINRSRNGIASFRTQNTKVVVSIPPPSRRQRFCLIIYVHQFLSFGSKSNEEEETKGLVYKAVSLCVCPSRIALNVRQLKGETGLMWAQNTAVINDFADRKTVHNFQSHS